MRSATAKIAVAPDPTVYPVEDDIGVDTLQRFISELLRVQIERFLAASGKATFVGANQFFYWKQHDASACVAPDVYVLPGAPLSPRVWVWKVWETGFVPSFAFEFVSSDVEKDYRTVPPKYARLEVDELVVFDPDHAQDPSRSRFQVYRKSKRGWSCVLHTNADRVRSQVLGCHLRVVGEGGAQRVRLATGFNGETLVPTDEEARASAEARESAEREKAEVERGKAERERERAEAAEAALSAERALRAALEAEIAELRAGQGKARNSKR